MRDKLESLVGLSRPTKRELVASGSIGVVEDGVWSSATSQHT
jgi:hypothetical protein